MGQPKLQQVADIAGVSISTASLVLSGKGKISNEVRERVLEAATRIGYKRRPASTPNVSRATRLVSFLFPFDYKWAFVYNFIRPIVIEVGKVLIKENYHLVIVPMTYASGTDEILSGVKSTEAKGVISIHYGDKTLFRQLERMGIPVIVIMNNNFQDKFYSVCVDDFQGAYEGCLHLIRLGHRNIAYLDYHRPDLPVVVIDRFIGFKKGIDEFNIPFGPEQRITVDINNREELTQKLKLLFSKKNRPTALFVHDDYLAFKAIVELKAMSIKIPEIVSIIAPGDVLDYNQPTVPQITTMKIDTALMGQIAGELMLKRLKQDFDKDDIHVLKIKQQLVQRGSCQRIQENDKQQE